MSSFFEELMLSIKRGREGKNIGISARGVGIDTISNILSGIQSSRYDLIGGGTGTGKTAFVDLLYVAAPMLYLYNNKQSNRDYYIIYNTLEISRDKKLAKLACLFLYLREGTLMDWKELLSYNDTGEILSKEKLEKVKKLEDIINFLETKMEFIEGFVNPTRIHVAVKKKVMSEGKIFHRKKGLGHSWIEGEAPREDRHLYMEKYVPDNEDLIIQVVTDHIGLLSPEKDSGVILHDKPLIDKHSKYCVLHRDSWGVSSVDISQFNREMSDISRRRFEELTPQLEDFKNTGSPTENADTVLALFNPERYNISKYRGYDITRMRKRFRSIFILKNRMGTDMIHIPTRFIGEVGHFSEIGKAKVVSKNNLYNKIMNLTNVTLYKLFK